MPLGAGRDGNASSAPRISATRPDQMIQFSSCSSRPTTRLQFGVAVAGYTLKSDPGLNNSRWRGGAGMCKLCDKGKPQNHFSLRRHFLDSFTGDELPDHFGVKRFNERPPLK
jgi:hypothetical protein